MAVFWLSASAAWANGVIGLKNATDESWIYTSALSPCQKIEGKYVDTRISECSQSDEQKGTYGGANASIVSYIKCYGWRTIRPFPLEAIFL